MIVEVHRDNEVVPEFLLGDMAGRRIVFDFGEAGKLAVCVQTDPQPGLVIDNPSGGMTMGVGSITEEVGPGPGYIGHDGSRLPGVPITRMRKTIVIYPRQPPPAQDPASDPKPG